MKQNVAGGVCLSICLLMASPSAAGADAVLRWNENAGKAATAACLSPEGNALAEAACTRWRIRRARCAERHRAQFAPVCVRCPGDRSERHPAPPSPPPRGTCWSRSSGSSRNPRQCIQSGLASVEADYAAALGEHSRQPAEKTRGIAVGPGGRRGHPRAAANDGSDTPLVGPRVSARRRSPASTGSRRYSVRVCAGLGRGDAVRAQRVARSSAPARRIRSEQRIYGGLQRGEVARRRRRHDTERAHAGADRDRVVLGRELAARVEPDRRGDLGARRSQSP